VALDPKIGNNAADAMMDGFDTFVAGGKLRIYESGSTPPATCATAIAGTLLAELTMGTPAFGASVNGVITAAAITSDSDANAAGTADYFRLWDSAGTDCALQGTAGEAADTCDMTLDDKAITLHATVACSAMTVTVALE
jgi:hypothetical protein